MSLKILTVSTDKNVKVVMRRLDLSSVTEQFVAEHKISHDSVSRLCFNLLDPQTLQTYGKCIISLNWNIDLIIHIWYLQESLLIYIGNSSLSCMYNFFCTRNPLYWSSVYWPTYKLWTVSFWFVCLFFYWITIQSIFSRWSVGRRNKFQSWIKFNSQW